VLASPGLVALSDANIARLARDHANARRFAEGVRSIEGMVVDGGASSSSSSSSSDAAAAAAPQTNIVVFGFSHGLAAKKNISHEDVAAALRKKGVKIAGFRDRLRAVTSYMVTEEGVDRAVEALREVMKELLV
jgi:threonine aldolase